MGLTELLGRWLQTFQEGDAAQLLRKRSPCTVDPLDPLLCTSEVAQSCPTLCDPMDHSLPGSSIHGIFQARVLEWVAISFSRGSSQPRDWTQVFRITGSCFIIPYNKLINVNKHVSLISVNHYSKLWNPRRSLWEPLSGTGWSDRCQPVIDLKLASEWWAVFTIVSFSQSYTRWKALLSCLFLYCLLMPQFPSFSNNI